MNTPMPTIGKLINVSGWTVIGIAVVWVIKNPEKAQLWFSQLEKAFAWAGSRVDKAAVKDSIEGAINLATKKLNRELTGIASMGIKIKWVDATSSAAQSYIDNDTLIVRLKPSSCPDENYVAATLAYVGRIVSGEVRRFLKPVV